MKTTKPKLKTRSVASAKSIVPRPQKIAQTFPKSPKIREFQTHSGKTMSPIEKRTKVTEEEKDAIRNRYKLFMGETTVSHTPQELGKLTSVGESTVNRIKRTGAIPGIDVILSMGRFLRISPVMLFCRFTDEPLPNAEEVEPDRGKTLRDLDLFATEAEKLPLLQRMRLLDILSDSVTSEMRAEAGEE